MRQYYANAIVKLEQLDVAGNLLNGKELFPGSYHVETYMGDDSFMRYVVFDSEEEYIWYRLQN